MTFIPTSRREDARATVGFIPDCVVLFTRLLRDERLPRRQKVLIAALIPYLASPIDLIPDFIPIAGQLDDAVLVAFVFDPSSAATHVLFTSSGRGYPHRSPSSCGSSRDSQVSPNARVKSRRSLARSDCGGRSAG